MVKNVTQIKCNDKCRCECENLEIHPVCQKDYTWNPTACSGENGNYSASIIDDSVITCHEIIEETKTISTNFNEKRQPVNKKIMYFTHHFINYHSMIDSC